jgi:hypothetical protein
MSKSGDINAQGLTRCVFCPQCGYNLKGLPDRGFCPECGFAYSPGMIVLYGSGEGGKRTGLGKLLSYIYLAAIVCAAIVMDRFPLFARAWTMPIVLIGFALLFAAYRRAMRGDMPAETQLRLSAEGFVQRDGVGEATLTPWKQYHKVELSPRWLDSGYVLKIRGLATQFVLDHPVQFVFEADQRTAHEIRLRINGFRRVAREASR